MFWVYALYNAEAHKLYIGQTNNLERRMAEHNGKLGNHFSAHIYGEWVLIYSESVATRSEALRRERQLMSAKGREFIKGHIPG